MCSASHISKTVNKFSKVILKEMAKAFSIKNFRIFYTPTDFVREGTEYQLEISMAMAYREKKSIPA
jgi:hypothetical protein